MLFFNRQIQIIHKSIRNPNPYKTETAKNSKNYFTQKET